MPEQNSLKSNSVLFWLAVFIAAGIICIGARFILDPLGAARGFGVPAGEGSNFAYLWTKGTRDIVSGLLLISLLGIKASRQVLGAFLSVAALIPLGDLFNVYANVGARNPMALIIHGGTAVFMIILASLTFRGSPSRSAPLSRGVVEPR